MERLVDAAHSREEADFRPCNSCVKTNCSDNIALCSVEQNLVLVGACYCTTIEVNSAVNCKCGLFVSRES